MAISLYDEAVYNKILKVVKDPNMKILKPEETSELFGINADEKKDKPLTLPLIALSRDKNLELLSTKKQPKTFDGFKLQYGEKCSIEMSVIPIKINYQLDIYTKRLNEADIYVREFIFYLINNPNVTINVPYNDVNVPHSSTVSLEGDIIDNSDISERLYKTQFTRFTIRFSVDDAYLFSVPIKDNARVEELQVNIVNNDNTLDSVENIEISN